MSALERVKISRSATGVTTVTAVMTDEGLTASHAVKSWSGGRQDAIREALAGARQAMADMREATSG